MVRIAFSQAAFAAIAATLALGTVAVEPERAEDGSVHIWLDRGVLAKLKALRAQARAIAMCLANGGRGGTAMSDDKADNIDAGLPRWPEPPLTPVERQRRVVRLCCSFMRNLAFHRAGMQGEVQFNLFARTHPQGAFWREAHGNFIDICVLDWCKLFADLNSPVTKSRFFSFASGLQRR
jgi:hypothetical protein